LGQLVQSFWASLGFEPDTIYIQACQEHGSEAIAHVVLTGRGADGWRIVLLPTFGKAKPRSRARSAAE